MKIVDLICGNELSPEQRKSNVGESSVLRRTRGPVIAGHDAVIGSLVAKWDSVSLIIGAHAGKGAATRYFSLEVVNVRRLQIRTRGLVVAAVFIQPGNWVWVGAAVRSDGLLIEESMNCGWRHQRYCG